MHPLFKSRFARFIQAFLIPLSYFTLRPYGRFPVHLDSKYGAIGSLKILVIPLVWLLAYRFFCRHKARRFFWAFYLLFLAYAAADMVTIYWPMHSTSLATYTAGCLFLALITYMLTHKSKLRLPVPGQKLMPVLALAITGILTLIPVIYLIYYVSFQVPLREEGLFAILQTNPLEATEFIHDFIPWTPIVLGLLYLGLILFLLGQAFGQRHSHPISKTTWAFTIIFGAVLVLKFSALGIPNLTIHGAYKYQKNLATFKALQEKRDKGLAPINASKKETGETYLVIIGESLNRRHMGLYGYPRPTTPHLKTLQKQHDLIVFQNAFSNHTHTMPTLSLSLTQANQYNHKSYFKSASLVDLANAANFQTWWISNQNMLGAWDNLVSIIGHQADHLVALNHAIGKTTRTDSLDGQTIPALTKALAHTKQGNTMIFVHLMGSHGSYCSRYPDAYASFSHSLLQGDFGTRIAHKKDDAQHKINCYDNSVLYNDHVVSQLIHALKKHGGVSAAVYFSDHADAVFKGLGHNSAKFQWSMTAIPLLFWASPQYQKKYPQKWAALKTHQSAPFTNDLIYSTVAGLADIHTDTRNNAYNLTSPDYALKPSQALTLHGRKSITDRHNYLWWQQANVESLIKLNQQSRVIPHRVDSIGKLHDIWQAGFRSFEVDVMFDPKTHRFIVGHNPEVHGKPFITFIQSVQPDKIEKIWFDFKNLNTRDHQAALAALEKLDARFNLKPRMIVESGNKEAWFHQFRQAGWHTSYYLPTNALLKRMKKQDVSGQKTLAKAIAEQVTSQHTAAVSFDNRLYPFVKKYLEPHLPDTVVYHSWWGPKINNGAFMAQLKRDPLYRDPRIKTLLVSFQSPYNL